MSNLIEARSITKVYNQGVPFTALEDISLSIAEQDYLAISGPSGAGKSTLLHIIAGLDSPSAGEVLFRGKKLHKLSDRQLSLWRNKTAGFVFQFYHLIEELNLLENVAISDFGTRRKYSFKKAEELLEYLGLAKRSRAYPSELSGGERQRAAIARALIGEPEILFCDEPTGNLDRQAQEKIIQLLENLNVQQKKTVVLVTHNRKLAERAKKVLIIEDGKINGGLR